MPCWCLPPSWSAYWPCSISSRRSGAIGRKGNRASPCQPFRLAPCRSRIRELHHAIFHLTEFHRHEVKRVVLVELPRLLRSLLWEHGNRALHITRGEIEPGFGLHFGVIEARRRLLHAALIDYVEQAADIFAGQIAFQRP